MATAAEHYAEAVEALRWADEPEQSDPEGCYRTAQIHALLGLLAAAIEGTAPVEEHHG